MSNYEVPQPILNSPYDAPTEHWHIVEGEPPSRVHGRRRTVYFYRDPRTKEAGGQITGVPVELELVSLIRQRVDEWRSQGYPGVTRTSLELLQLHLAQAHPGRRIRMKRDRDLIRKVGLAGMP